MRISSLFKRCCIALWLLILLACGGGGESSAPSPSTPVQHLFLAQSSIDFAGIVLDKYTERTFWITNTGDEGLSIGQILQPDLPFSIISDTCSNTTLAARQSCSVAVRFSPTDHGAFTAHISIPSNDPNLRTANINLSGVGYGLNVWINRVFADSCPSMSIDVTVTDPGSNNLLNMLTANNFRLNQNGQLQNITVSSIQYPAPVSLVLSIDWSGSATNVMTDIQAAANSFISQLNNGDWAAICKFNTNLWFYPDPTPLFIEADASGKTLLNNYINTPLTVGETAFYDAVFQSVDRAAQGTTDKRAVIVLSDGEDSMSAKTLDQVIANAIQKGIPVFTIYYVDPVIGASSDGYRQNMQRLATETGGQYYDALTADFASIFQQISNTLSNKYTINYTSSTCSGIISLDVRVDWNGLYGQDPRTVSFP